nr:hypothetical protein [Burkholderia gladioli]
MNTVPRRTDRSNRAPRTDWLSVRRELSPRARWTLGLGPSCCRCWCGA